MSHVLSSTAERAYWLGRYLGRLGLSAERLSWRGARLDGVAASAASVRAGDYPALPLWLHARAETLAAHPALRGFVVYLLAEAGAEDDGLFHPIGFVGAPEVELEDARARVADTRPPPVEPPLQPEPGS